MSDVGTRLAGVLADRYRIERELGAGGMATVYLAQDLKHSRKVAIKVLRPELAAVIGAERFLREIQTIATLQHPHILGLIDSGEVNGTAYYVMPFVEGESLRDRLHREKQLPVSDAVRLATEVAAALDYVHRHGVIHRDIKPENIMLHDGSALVADFGIALAVSSAGGSRMTETGMSLGTPHYMSPEQAASERNLDSRSDQYALGAVAYEMLSGEPPHTGPTAQVIIARLMAEKPRSLRATRPGVPPAVDAAVERALSKTPADRFASCGAFAQALVVRTSAGVAAGAAPRRRGLWVAAAVALVVLAAGGLALAGYVRGRGPTIDSIVVLPFANRSNDPETDYISDGLTESISNSLTRLPNLRVIPTSVAFHYKGKPMSLRQVGDELHTAAVLTGRVAQRGDSVFVGAELDDVREGSQLWGAQYDRRLTDLLAVQRDIASAVSERLGARHSEVRARRLRSGSTDNPEAYRLYLKGMYFTARFTKEGFDRGRAFFQQALAIDSNYALAWDGLAWNYVTASDWYIPPREAAPLAKSAARKALAIDSTLASAYVTLGIVSHWYDWEWPAAEQAFLRAIAMDTTNARPHDYYAWFLASMGRYDEAVAQAEQAQQLAPVSVEASQMLGMVLVLAHRYDRAIIQLRTALDLDPTYFYAEDFLGRAYEQTNRLPDALAAYQRAVDLDRGNAENWSNLGHAYAVSGNPARARQIIAQLKATSTRRYVGPYNLALIYAGLGQADQAFHWLDRANQDGSSLPVLYSNDARWDRFHSDPRYAALVRRFRLPDQAPGTKQP